MSILQKLSFSSFGGALFFGFVEEGSLLLKNLMSLKDTMLIYLFRDIASAFW